MLSIHPRASVAPTAVVTGDVVIGAGCRVLAGAVVDGTRGPVRLGEDVVVMEHAVLRGRVGHALTIGDAVLVGPHANVTGSTVGDEVFIATGACLFAGSVVGRESELRIHSVLQVNSVLEPGSVVPIGWIAVGDPAQLFPPERHDEIWAIQRTLDFPGTMYGVQPGTSMRELMRVVSDGYV